MDFDVLVIGGGIQGAGILHDLASRRLSVHLLEERKLAIGTSSRSTKLVHGGLRYLERMLQWPLVHEALQERALLLRLLGPVVKPLPFVLPTGASPRPTWMIRMGLGLYDLMAGDSGLPRSRSLSRDDLVALAPYLRQTPSQGNAGSRNSTTSAFLFFDAQMIDDAIVRLAAHAAVRLGGSYEERAQVTHVSQVGTPSGSQGFKVIGHKISSGQKTTFEYRARIVVLAAGAWNNWNLVRWGVAPRIPCLLNAGAHLVFAKEAVAAPQHSCAASLIQNSDGRALFFIPWCDRWLFGTTESELYGDPRNLKPSHQDLSYLEHAVQQHLDLAPGHRSPVEVFSGVRTMPMRRLNSSPTLTSDLQDNPFQEPFYPRAGSANMSKMSRESVIDEPVPDLMAIYGGKYTTYRALAERIGRIVKDRLGRGGPSLTRTPDAWFLAHMMNEEPSLFLSDHELRSA
jgi:glycerol-3-phosphate dehydrogenase